MDFISHINSYNPKNEQETQDKKIIMDCIKRCIYNFTFPIMEHEKARFAKLTEEFELK